MPDEATRPGSVSASDVDVFLAYAQKEKGLDLGYYRKTFLGRRLTVRLDATNTHTLAEYIAFLRSDAREWPRFIDNLSINVSEFFRDIEVYRYFSGVCIPELVARKKKAHSNVIRCWSCGCSCGEEAYSLAISFKEFFGHAIDSYLLHIWATDVDEDALRKAREGIYEPGSLAKVNTQQLRAYFKPAPSGKYQITDEIRRYVQFKKINLLTDAFLGEMDIIFFRNVRIYFNESKAETIYARVFKALKKDGYLVLGRVETLGTLKNVFEPVSLGNKIFRKR